MITDKIGKIKTVKTEERNDSEVERLREQVSLLQKRAGIDPISMETERIRQENDARMQAAQEEEQRKRSEEAERKKIEQIERISRVFHEQFNKKIKLFRIHSDQSGRRAIFCSELPILCPGCGSDNISSMKDTASNLVGKYDALQRDPVILLEAPAHFAGSIHQHCSNCQANFMIHYQVSL